MNSVEITPVANDITFISIANDIALSLFDIHSTSYFLSEASMIEVLTEVGGEEE